MPTTPPVDLQEKLLDCLGGPWPAPCPLDARIENTHEADGFRIQRVSYAVEPDERVASLLLIPNDVGRQPRAGICVWHQHAGQWNLGKSEPAGLAGNPMHHTGAALAREGYVVLCPDAIGFEERETGRLKGGDLERFLFLRYVVDGKSMAWKNILDMRRAVDYLASRAEVDPNRLGCYGHSMGSTHTWLVGPWEPRLRALVGNCCLPTYEDIHREELMHCFPNFIPGFYQYADTPDLVALIAPRPLLLNFGEHDGGTPIEDARRGIVTIRRAYEAQHAEANFEAFVQDGVRHVLSPEMWAWVRTFFAKHLGVGA